MNKYELELVKTFIEIHPAAAVRELELQPPEKLVELLSALPLALGQRIIHIMLPPYVARLCLSLPIDASVSLLSNSNANTLSRVLRYIPKSTRDEILKRTPEKTAALCRFLLSYSEDTVGAWMTADMLMLPIECTAVIALKRLAQIENFSDIGVLPIVDRHQHLLGVVSVRGLLGAKAETAVTHFMNDPPPALPSRTSVVSAVNNEGWYNHDTLVVLNRSKQLVGFLRHVDLRKSLKQFNERSKAAPQDDLFGGIGEAYVGALSAMLGLVGGKTNQIQKSMLGESL